MPDGNLLVSALDRLDVGIGVFDASQKLVACNAPFGALRGYPPELCELGTALEDMLRFNARRGDFGDGGPGEQVADRLRDIATTDEREIVHEMADGQVLMISYRHLDGGGLMITYRDFTSEHRAQEALANSEERYSLDARAAADSIYDWNLETDRIFVSDRFRQLLDIKGEVSSSVWGDSVHPEDSDTYVEALREHFRGNTEIMECEYRVVRHGETCWVRDRGIGVRNENGWVTRFVGTLRDITEIKAAAGELDRTKTRLLDSLEALSEGFLLVDAEDKVQLWNRRYTDIFSAASDVDVTDVCGPGRALPGNSEGRLSARQLQAAP